MYHRSPDHYDRKPYLFSRKLNAVASDPQLLKNNQLITLTNRISPDQEQRKKIALIKAQLFQNIEEQIRSIGHKSARSSNNEIKGNLVGTGINKYENRMASKASYIQIQMQLKEVAGQNQKLTDTNTKQQRDIQRLKRLLEQRQNIINQKDKIIKKFVSNKLEGTNDSQNQLRRQLVSAGLTIDSLKSQIQKFISNNNTLKDRVQQLEKKDISNYDYSNKQHYYENIIKTQKEELFEVEEKTKYLKAELRKVEGLKREVFELRSQVRNYNIIKKQYSSNQHQLMKSGKRVTSSDVKLLQSIVQNLKNELQNQSLKVQRKQKQLEQYRNKQYKLRQKIDDQINQKSQLDEERKQEVNDLKSQIQLLYDRIRAAEQKIEGDQQIIINFQEREANEQENIFESKMIQKKYLNQIKMLQGQLVQLSTKNTQLNENILEYVKQLELIDKKNNELLEKLQYMKNHIDKSKNQQQNSKSEIEQKQLKINQLNMIINKYQEDEVIELRRKEELLKKIDKIQEERQNQKEKFYHKLKQNQQRLKQEEQLKKHDARSEVQRETQRVIELEKKLQVIMISSDELSNKTNELLSQNTSLKREIQSLTSNSQALKEKLLQTESTIFSNGNLIQQLKITHQQKLAEIQTQLTQKIFNLENDKQVLQTQKESLKSQLKQQVQTLTLSSDELSNKTNELLSQNTSLKREIQSFSHQLTNLQIKYNTLNLTHNAVNIQLNALQLDTISSSTLQHSLSLLKTKISDLQTLISNLSSHNQKLSIQNSSLSQQLFNVSQLNTSHLVEIQTLKRIVQMQPKTQNSEQSETFNAHNLQLFIRKHPNLQKNQLIDLTKNNLINLVLGIQQQTKKYKQSVDQKQKQLLQRTNVVSNHNNPINNILLQRQTQNEFNLPLQLVKTIEYLGKLYNHPKCTQILKKQSVIALFELGIQPLMMQQSEVNIKLSDQKGTESKLGSSITQRQPTFIKIFSQRELNSVTQAQIVQIVFTYLGNNNRLANHVLQFLTQIIKIQNIVLQSELVVKFCRELREFQDQVQDKVTKLQKAIALYINKTNQVFFYNQEQIQNASESKSNSQQGISENDSSKSQIQMLPQFSQALNLHSLLNPLGVPGARQSVDKSLPIQQRPHLSSKKNLSSSMIKQSKRINQLNAVGQRIAEVQEPLSSMMGGGVQAQASNSQKKSANEIKSLSGKSEQQRKKKMMNKLSKSAMKKDNRRE